MIKFWARRNFCFWTLKMHKQRCKSSGATPSFRWFFGDGLKISYIIHGKKFRVNGPTERSNLKILNTHEKIAAKCCSLSLSHSFQWPKNEEKNILEGIATFFGSFIFHVRSFHLYRSHGDAFFFSSFISRSVCRVTCGFYFYPATQWRTPTCILIRS